MSATRHRDRDRQDRPDRGTIHAARNSNRDHRDPPTCGHCGDYCNPNKAVEESFCSRKCYYRHKGVKALKNVEKDHRFCRTCFAKCKEVEDPPDRVPDFVVGYQYGTEDATTAERSYTRTDDDFFATRPLIRQRLGCWCGATDLRSFDATLATAELETTLVNLVAALREKYREDKLPLVDYRRLFDAYRNTADLEYSVGVGLYE